jgi:general secretion pathway protein B
MSLIHEALKKAEEQRRLGQPPDLASPFSRPRERQPLLPFLLVAIVIAGGVGWWLLRTPTASTAAKPADSSAARTATTTGPQKSVGPQDSAKGGDLEHTAARSSSAERMPVPAPPPSPPPGALPAPNAGPTKGPPGSVPPTAKLAPGQSTAAPVSNPAGPNSDKGIPPGAAQGQAKPDPEGLAQAMNKAAPIAANTTPLNTANKPSGPVKVDKVPIPDTGPGIKPAAPATMPPADMAASAPGTKKAELPEDAPVTGPALNPVPDAPVAAKADTTLPLFWQLPYATRKELPQLAVTMHVYAADPGKRFIVINGDHKAEGDPIGNDLIVREIRSDGVVMEFRGQRFLVPRGGS